MQFQAGVPISPALENWLRGGLRWGVVVQAERAEAAANAAELYATAASVSARFYDTIALGRAAVADGATFGVIAGGSDGLTRATIYRRDSSSTQTALVQIVPGSDVDDLSNVLGIAQPNSDVTTEWAIVNAAGIPQIEGDYSGRLWLAPVVLDPQSGSTGPITVISIANVSGIVVAAIKIDQATGEVELTRTGEFVQDFSTGEWPNPYFWNVTDENDNTLFQINKPEGTFYGIPDADTTALIRGIAAGGLSPAAISTALLPGNICGGQSYSAGLARYWTDASGKSRAVIGRATAAPVWIEEGRGPLEWIASTGDSTSQGSGGDTLRITGAPAPNTGIMLGTGIRGGGTTVYDPALDADFAPAVEAVASPLGSTGWASFCQYMETQQATGPRVVHVVRTSGMSGSRLDEQLEGSTYFENSIAEATRARAIALEYGRTMVCPTVYLRNGANDRSAGRTLAAYKADLVAMQARYTARLNAVFGVSGQVDLFQSQLAGGANIGTSPGKDAGQIAQAQIEAALENANIFLTAPEYIFPMAPGNTVHGPAIKYDLMGEYNAKARIRRRLGATRFCPMPRLSSISVVGAVVTVSYDLVQVPGSTTAWFGLQFSTAFRANRTNKGFEATGTRTVSSVAITDTGATTGVGIVQVTLSGSPAAGDALEYAYTGATSGVETDYPAAWGNLCDLDTAASVTAAGVTLFNPTPSFRKVIA